jgi:hypothetical protein
MVMSAGFDNLTFFGQFLPLVTKVTISPHSFWKAGKFESGKLDFLYVTFHLPNVHRSSFLEITDNLSSTMMKNC